MSKTTLSNLKEMSVADRLQMIQLIWDSIESTERGLPLTPGQEQELDRRLADYEENPDQVTPWSEIKNDLLGNR